MESEIFNMVQQLVRQHGTRDPFELAESLGIEIMRSDRINDLKGMYMYILRNPFIVINTNESEEIQRIVCAHELGHDRMHRALAAHGAMQELSLFDMTAKPEYEANVFASELLITDDDIMMLKDAGYDIFQISAELGLDVNITALKILQMKQRGYPFDIDVSFYDRRFIQ